MDAIRMRRSVRNYQPVPLTGEHAAVLEEAIVPSALGPFGGRCRLRLLRPSPEHPDALKGLTGLLGTYGFINDAQAFVVGAVGTAPHALEDFGYLMEGVVLKASAIGVASCWLGGAFRKSRFASVMGLERGECVPAVVSLGYDLGRKRLLIDAAIERHHCYRQERQTWSSMFFGESTFGLPLEQAAAGVYVDALEAVRLAPSSCNTQTWRIVRASAQTWHLFCQRNVKYARKDHLIGNADLQRVDMGIAMRHFEEVARARGREGRWKVQPAVAVNAVPEGVSYVASWCEVA
jgi:Putative TM nitroreductase